MRLFSPWSELTDAASRRILKPPGWSEPTQGYPTGAQGIEQYLAPLADALGDRVSYGARVVGVGRNGRDLSVDAGLHEHRMPAIEAVNALAGQHLVVVGNGHSAATTIGILSRVAKRETGTRITWVLRRGAVGNTFGGGSADELPERGALGQRAKKAVEDGLVVLVTGFRTEQVEIEDGQAVLVAEDGRQLDPAARVYVATGFRADLSFLSEVRLDLDMRPQAPSRSAAELDPNLHSCGSIRATGAADLKQPEPGFYIVGAKSYGRAPTFLALTGFEQLRSVVAAIAGDSEAAERGDLVLPDTGVCGGSGLFDAPEESSSGGCCAPAPQLVQMDTRSAG